MLVVARKINEKTVIRNKHDGSEIIVMPTRISNDFVRIGIEAALEDYEIHRHDHPQPTPAPSPNP